MQNTMQKGAQFNLKNGVLFLKTKESAPAYGPGARCDIWMGLKFGEGNFTWSIAKNFDYQLDRGKLDDVRSGDEAPIDVSFQGKYTFCKSRGNESYSPHEIIDGHDFEDGTVLFNGAAENWLSEFGCPPYACELEFHNNPAMECPGTTAHGEAQLFRYFRAESIQCDARAGTIDVSGKCHILRPFIKRVDASGGSGGDFGYIKKQDMVPLDDSTPTVWPNDAREIV